VKQFVIWADVVILQQLSDKDYFHLGLSVLKTSVHRGEIIELTCMDNDYACWGLMKKCLFFFFFSELNES
jgi:hypothetical protein